MAPDPVIHHVEMCVSNAENILTELNKFGFKLFAKRNTPLCKQLVVKLGFIKCIITERKHGAVPYANGTKLRSEHFTTFCCEQDSTHETDSVFNICFLVTNIELMVKKIKAGGGHVVTPITQLTDEKYGELKYCIVKSCCGNVLHTIVQKSANFSSPFLLGFDMVDESAEYEGGEKLINYIDHVTLATNRGHSEEIISFYEMCFGMKKFSISNNDDVNNGLILEEGVGLRLRAMEYYRCSETGLLYTNSGNEKERNPSTLMLVIVETLEGQTNCNVETFLNEHGKPGVEHIALSSMNIVHSVSSLISNGVRFRKPPILYYEELGKNKEIMGLGKDLKTLEKLGILLDLEEGSEEETNKENKFLMQIFARSLFNRQTFFIEVIERCGSTGLGQGNILALVRSIREEERRKAVDAEKKKLLQAREASVTKNLETIRAT